MRRYIIILAVAAFVAGIAVTGLGNGKTGTTKANAILSVSDIQADPNAYKGSIIVTGVVAKISKDNPRLFAIVDTTEAKHCKSLGCAKFYLPVNYQKGLPKEWDEINATGNIVKKDGLLFEATKMEILRHLTFKDN